MIDHAVNGSTSGAPILQAQNVTMRFDVSRRTEGGAVFAARDVSLSLTAGTTLALVGESGSGKSTVAQILAQLLHPTAGQVLLNGSPVRIRGERARRRYARQVQLLLQDPFSSLNPLHTIRYTLERAIKIHASGRVSGRALDDRIADLLSRVKLTPPKLYLGKFPHELSGGQLQRIAIARTLAAQPRVLLLDEPVSMLDVSIRVGILNLLTELKKQENLALLYITHDIASGRYFSDHVIVMYHGRMVEGGPSEVVTQSPAHPYTELLISSSPDPERNRAPSAPPSREGRTRGDRQAEVLPACPFAPRCPHAMDKCRTHEPPRVELGGGHWSTCWLTTERATAAQSLSAGGQTRPATA